MIVAVGCRHGQVVGLLVTLWDGIWGVCAVDIVSKLQVRDTSGRGKVRGDEPHVEFRITANGEHEGASRRRLVDLDWLFTVVAMIVTSLV